MNTAQAKKSQRFYELHQEPEILVLPNAWDAINEVNAIFQSR